MNLAARFFGRFLCSGRKNMHKKVAYVGKKWEICNCYFIINILINPNQKFNERFREQKF